MSLFDDMTTFVRAVEAGSFSGAAQKLGVAKSMVSRRIAALEARLGASLFHRTTRRLRLTEIGLAYADRARQILADVAEADEIAGCLQSALRGRLSVAAPMSFGLRHLSGAIAAFLTLHPELEIELDLNDRNVDLVSEGHDLAMRIGDLSDSSLIARRLASCRQVVCASPAYLAARGAPLTPADLAAHDGLIYSNRTAAEIWRFRVGGEWRTASPGARRLGANNGESLLDAAIAGLGLTILPTFIVGDAVAKGDLSVILADYPLPSRSLYAVWPPNRQLSAKVRAFVDFLVERCAGAPYWDRPLVEAGLIAAG
ncbi:MAG TPA: LysR family transcriptional regulator [Caulobacteraceae bacterium]|nr:LysR family transcriptional regulator [Caulobacteraceae bacterium]